MKLLRLISLSVLLFAPLGVSFAGIDEGIEYKRLPSPMPTVDPKKIELLELFWYGCPHCYRFEPKLKKWLKKKPANVVFVRVPAIFNPRWGFHAKVYYTAEVLGVLDKLHDALFEAIHVQRKQMKTVEEVRKLFVRYGVKPKDFDKAFASFMVDAKVRRAKDLTRRYGISGVPSLVVNGKYVTDGPMASSAGGMLKVVDYLIEKESAASKQ